MNACDARLGFLEKTQTSRKTTTTTIGRFQEDTRTLTRHGLSRQQITHIRVKRGAHEHKGEIFSLQCEVPEDDDEEVGVDGSLVHLSLMIIH